MAAHHARNFIGTHRIGMKEALGQPHRTEIDAHRQIDAGIIAADELGAAAADIDDK